MEDCKICLLDKEERRKYILYSERLMAIKELKNVDLKKYQKYLNIDENMIEEQTKIMAKEAEEEIYKINSNI